MNADDDGVVEAYSVMNLVKANEDDLRVLIGKDYESVAGAISVSSKQ